MGLKWSISSLASDTHALRSALQRAVLSSVWGTGAGQQGSAFHFWL